MARFAHFLPRNHSNEMPSNCIWFDTETTGTIDAEGREHHSLNFGYAVFQRREAGQKWSHPEWLRFTTRAEFWEWVYSKTRSKTRLYLFSHNGAFDLPVMAAFTELPKMGFKLGSAVADAPPLILSWRGNQRTIRFIDTLNIWRLPLEKIGQSIGLEKLAMPSDPDDTEAWDRYGKRDTEIIRRAVLAWLAFLVDHDLGGFAPTLASQAFGAYRHRFMPCPIFIDANEKSLELSRRAYVGGRTECFFIGQKKGRFYYVDVNSMYPSVMQAEQFPFRLVGIYQRPTVAEIRRWSADFHLVADVTINTDQANYPVIDGNKLIFPVGRFSGALSHPELMLAHERGHIEKWHQVAVYERDRLFQHFIEEIYALRLDAKTEGNSVQAWLFKILQNSLYGKFGQRGRRYETVGECDPNLIEVWTEIDADDGTIVNKRRFGGIEQEWVDEPEAKHSFPAIAAAVTSYARLKLLQAIELAGRENCYYCDTDSLVVNQAGFDALADLVDDRKLGAWALEYEFDSLTINAPKDYAFGEKARTKGVRSNALWLDRNTVEQDKFVGLRGLLRAGNLDGPIVYRQQKCLKREYSKGLVDRSGVVTPLTLSGA